MTNQPKLSEVLGIKRKEENKFSSNPDICFINPGYNKCINELDQLSPDVNKLSNKIKSYCTNSLKVDFSSYGAEKLAKEIINSMSKWIIPCVEGK